MLLAVEMAERIKLQLNIYRRIPQKNPQSSALRPARRKNIAKLAAASEQVRSTHRLHKCCVSQSVQLCSPKFSERIGEKKKKKESTLMIPF